MTPSLSIAIVLHNSADTLAACVRSLSPSVDAGWAEVIFVDNASPDESVEIAEAELPRGTVVRLGVNRGFAAGVNAALDRATGDWWLLLNPDVEVPPGGLETLVEWMGRHPQLGAASPDIVSATGEWESPGRPLPSTTRTVVEMLRLHRALPKKLRGRLLRGPYWTGGDQLDTGWVPGTAMIVRPAAARAAGPLREDLFMYGEDLEWCWRMRRAGWNIGVCANTTFVHSSSASATKTFGHETREHRMAAGMAAACREMYGDRRTRLLAAVTAISLELEARSPGRDPERRARALRAARIWRALARE